uniref:Harmonin n=1 Tax=Petromyzon marinus TaxID=7757 RepID=A0AAJ7XJZ2_PETMA|nr:harmonin [Petromyzon marinus]
MEKKVAREFRQKVDLLIDNEAEKDYLYDILRLYHQSLDVSTLVGDMKLVVSSPPRLPLFDSVRPLIPAAQQLQYDRLVPKHSRSRVREVRLERTHPEGLGLSVRGGAELGCGVYVAQVVRGGQAHAASIQVGDEVVRVNGFSVASCTHDEVLSLMRARRSVALKVRHVGMIPVKNSVEDPLTWQFVDQLVSQDGDEGSSLAGLHSNSEQWDQREKKIFISLMGNHGMGCSVSSGPPHSPGIFISSVKPASVSAEVGLEVGDQVVEVNGIDFTHIDHREAVAILKASRSLTLTIHSGAGVDLFQTEEERRVKQQERVTLRVTLLKEKQIALEQSLVHRRRQADVDRKRQEEEESYRKELQRITEMEERYKHDWESDWKTSKEKAPPPPPQQQPQPPPQPPKQGPHSKSPGSKGTVLGWVYRYEGHFPTLKKKSKGTASRRAAAPDAPGAASSSSSTAAAAADEEEAPAGAAVASVELKKSRKEVEFEGRLLREREEAVKKEKRLKINRLAQEVSESEREECGAVGHVQGWVEKLCHTRLQQMAPAHSEVPPTESPEMLKRMVVYNKSFTKSQGYQKYTEDFDPLTMFTKEEIGDREVRLLHIRKEGPLDLAVEGGVDSPLGGKVVVSSVYQHGAVDRHGGVVKGDQILAVNGRSLIDVPLAEARDILAKEYKASGDWMDLVLGVAPPKSYEDEVTFF